MHTFSISLLLVGSLLLAGCSGRETESQASNNLEVIGEQDGFPVFADEHLQFGQGIWMDTCRNCHQRGVADAPIVTKFEAWETRISKGKPVLYEHAINGFFGEDYSMMPARGGNDALSDDEVKAAVDYMVAVATHSAPDSAQD